MKSKIINLNSPQTYVLVLDTDDEVVSSITRFAKENGLSASSLTAIGAFKSAELGYYDFEQKEYVKIPVNEQVEVLSMIGDISIKDGEPMLHAHIVVGKRDGSAHGGHLMKAYVNPTLEVILTESPSYLYREMDDKSGIPLIKL